MACYIFLVICLASLQYVRVRSDNISPLYCLPRPSLIPIDSPYFNYYPYYVELHRCGGVCLSVSPSIQKCSAASTQTISRTVFDLSSGQTKQLDFFNHTKCNCSCTKSPGSCDERFEIWNPATCDCKCKITKENPFKCPADFKWNQHVCRCLCSKAPRDCGAKKGWNKDVCDCVCNVETYAKCTKENKILDRNTCQCYDDEPPNTSARGAKGIAREILIGCMVAELILLLILFDIFLYCRYGDGVVTSMRRRFCSRKKHGDVPLKTQNAET